jgi:hypothetical protein
MHTPIIRAWLPHSKPHAVKPVRADSAESQIPVLVAVSRSKPANLRQCMRVLYAQHSCAQITDSHQTETCFEPVASQSCLVWHETAWRPVLGCFPAVGYKATSCIARICTLNKQVKEPARHQAAPQWHYTQTPCACAAHNNISVYTVLPIHRSLDLGHSCSINTAGCKAHGADANCTCLQLLAGATGDARPYYLCFLTPLAAFS